MISFTETRSAFDAARPLRPTAVRDHALPGSATRAVGIFDVENPGSILCLYTEQRS